MAKTVWSGALAVFGIVLNGTALGFHWLGQAPLGEAAFLLGEAALLTAIWLWYKSKPQRLEARVSITPRRPIGQEQYAELLRHDEAAKASKFIRLTSHLERGIFCKRCNGAAAWPTVMHPIWDGPFDEAGSGKVDVRHLIWCVRCDGQLPDPFGAPVRLPYLDNLPIRLLPELYARAAFQQLAMPVELYVAPEICSRCGDTFPIHSKTNSRDCPGTMATAHPSSAEVADCPGCKTIGEPHWSPSREHPAGFAGLMEDA